VNTFHSSREKVRMRSYLPFTLTSFLPRSETVSQHGNIVFPFFCHFERSEKSLFRPEEEIYLRSLAFARDDNPKLKHCNTDSNRRRVGVKACSPLTKLAASCLIYTLAAVDRNFGRILKASFRN
jgi:hypothetical protein